MIFGRLLPGELNGTLDPRDYGFGVIRDELLSREEECQLIAAFYRKTRARTGIIIPKLEPYLASQPFDPEPVRALLSRYENRQYPYVCEFGGVELVIDADVFDPTLTWASWILGERWWKFRKWSSWYNDYSNHGLYIKDWTPNAILARARPGTRVLDAFTGSGVFGIMAAQQGARVVSFDISPQAVACATKNAAHNGVGENVDVRHGSLYECVKPGERFDLVIANPPLLPGVPTTPLETALFDPGLWATKELIASLPQLLANRGRCYLLTSDITERKGYEFDLIGLCRKHGLRTKIVAQHHRDYESYRIHEIRRSWRRWP